MTYHHYLKGRPILLLAIAQTLIWACIYYSFPALLLHWEASLGWSRADLTGAVTLAIFMSAFCSPLYGRLIDSGKGPQMMTAASVLGGLCMMSLALVTELWQFYSLWAVIGVCMAGSLYEPCFALITRARGAEAKRSIIFVTLVAGFAGTVSFPVAHGLVQAFGWRSAVLCFGITAILIVAPLMWLGASAVEKAGTHRHIGNPQPELAERSFLYSPVFWFLAVGFGLVAVVQGVTLHHLLPILSERDMHPDVAVMAISFIGPMQVAGRLTMIAAERRVSIHGIAIACFVLIGLSIVMLNSAGVTPGLMIAFVILYGGAYGVVSIIRPVIARNLLGERQFGAKSGGLALIYLAGSASAPFLGALVWSRGGYSLVLPGLIGLALTGLLLYVLAHRLVEKKQRE